jgi:hypothetical protein
MEIHGKDLQTVEAALRVASAQYRKDAEVQQVSGQPRTAAQFHLQATACDRLLHRIADEGEDD